MTKVNLVLAESSLELVPRELWGHPSVLKNARRRGKRPGETLLDVSLHYHAMKKLPMREKRGRPDIVHVALLEALSSPLNLEGHLNIYVHTITDHVIYIRSDVRIPRNYRRFVGLMEQLLTTGKVPPDTENPLLYVKAKTLRGLIEEIECDKAILLSEDAPYKRPLDIARECKGLKVAIIIGGFPHGDFSSDTVSVADEAYSIYSKTLETWTVVSRMLAAFEYVLGIC